MRILWWCLMRSPNIWSFPKLISKPRLLKILIRRVHSKNASFSTGLLTTDTKAMRRHRAFDPHKYGNPLHTPRRKCTEDMAAHVRVFGVGDCNWMGGELV